jgi:hypothetical protein
MYKNVGGTKHGGFSVDSGSAEYSMAEAEEGYESLTDEEKWEMERRHGKPGAFWVVVKEEEEEHIPAIAAHFGYTVEGDRILEEEHYWTDGEDRILVYDPQAFTIKRGDRGKIQQENPEDEIFGDIEDSSEVVILVPIENK